jgi:hypothetical protein
MIFTRSRERDNNGMPAGALEFSKLNCRMLRRWPSLARDARARGRVTARGCQHRARIRIPSAGERPPTCGHTRQHHHHHCPRYPFQGCENTHCIRAHACSCRVLQALNSLALQRVCQPRACRSIEAEHGTMYYLDIEAGIVSISRH